MSPYYRDTFLLLAHKLNCALQFISLWLWPPLLVVAMSLMLLPLSPTMPVVGLDQSWALAMSQALAQGLAFGRDIIWTYGPYAAIYTNYYHPAINGIIITATVYLVIIYSLAILLLFRHKKWYLQWLLLITFWLIAPWQVIDAMLFYYPVLSTTYIVQTLRVARDKQQDSQQSPIAYLLLILLSSLLGLLPIIKVSLLPLDALTIILLTLLFLMHRAWYLALLVVISPLLTMGGFWLAASQHLSNLPAYIINSLPILTGFAEALGDPELYIDNIVYYYGAAVMMLGIAVKKITPQQQSVFNSTRFCYVVILAAAVFSASKENFINHYNDTAQIFLILLDLLVLAMPGTIRLRTTAIAIMASIIWLASFVESIDLVERLKIEKYRLQRSWPALQVRLWQPQQLVQRFQDTLVALHKEVNLPKLAGTSDIYSYGQAALFASGNVWQPRPIIQGYQAYNARLSTINHQHLLGANKPDNIFFKIETINNHLPTLDDGVSWPTILSNYQPVRMLAKDYLLLKQHPSKLSSHSLGLRHYNLAALVTVPTIAPNTLIFAKIKIRHTLLGAIVNFLLKSPPIYITLDLPQHQSKRYHLIAEMAETGFILSPLLESTQEFAALYAKSAALAKKQVKSFTINAAEFTTRSDWGAVNFPPLWQAQYTVEFFALKR